MADGKRDPKTPNGGAAESKQRARLGAVTVATNRLVAALDAVGLIQQVRESPTCRLRALDRNLPNDTLEDLLLGCEAFAAVTAPAALATGDLARVRAEAQRSLRLLQSVADAVRGRRRLSLMGTATGTQSVFLRSALSEPPVQDALGGLIDALSALVTLEEVATQKRRRLPIGPGCVIPTAVLGGAAGLIVVLLASIALATGQAHIAPNALNIPLTKSLPTATPPPTATPRPHSTPTPRPGSTATPAPGGAPTPTPRPGGAPTPTPGGGYGVLSVSPTSIAPCSSNNDNFKISYDGGSKSLTWSISSTDPGHLSFSPASGTLTPGGSVDVTVSNTSDTNQGTITVNGGAQHPTVSFDATNC